MKKIVIVLLLIFTIGCDPNIKPEKPQNLIPETEMSNVLYDMFVMNSARNTNKKLLEVKGVSPQQYILDRYKIDSLQFAQSNNYYAYDVEVYKSIIEKVKTRIETERDAFDAIEKELKDVAQQRRDSIRAAREKNKDSIVQEAPLDLIKDLP